MPSLTWLKKFVLLGTVRGVPIFAHWTVPAIAIFLLGLGIERELVAVSGVSAYLCMLAIHELGHQMIAQARGYKVNRIELYPLHGLCLLDRPQSALDASLIAIGGALAQLIVAAPFCIYRLSFGYTRFEPVNAFIAILGFLSPVVAVFNLVPVAPLDGRTAWNLIPLLWRRTFPGRAKATKDKTLLEEFEELARNVRQKR